MNHFEEISRADDSSYGMKDPSTAIPDEMKQSGASTENTSGQAPEHGSQNTSRVVPHANKTRT
jgi:hypothetical protein